MPAYVLEFTFSVSFVSNEVSSVVVELVQDKLVLFFNVFRTIRIIIVFMIQ